MLEDPLYYLAEYLQSGREQKLTDPPSEAEVDEHASELWSETKAKALLYLIDERGLSEDTIKQAQIGWDRDKSAFVFPVFNAAKEPVNLVRRPWPGEHVPKYKGMEGRSKENGGVELYPRPLPAKTWLLVEGLLDALLLRQEGLAEAVTPTHGVNSFPPACLPLVKGRKIAVAFDVGVEGIQRERVAELRSAGADAWGCDLTRLGLGRKGDLSDYLLGGGTESGLRCFLNRERRRAA